MINKLNDIFLRNFGATPLIVRSPGRVNIIGEHTDYNEGFVLPAAIDKAIYVAIAKRTDDTIRLYAEDFKEHYECRLGELKPAKQLWANYIIGVADQLQNNGYNINGFDLAIDGDVPIGAGLSSSAAVECAVIYALNNLFSLGLEKMQMVKMAQKAEHIFAGVNCGIMDQFASMFGKKNNAIKLDCRSLIFEYVPLDLKGYKIVLFNTNVNHSLSSSQYNIRRQQCEQGVAWLNEIYPEVKSLRDATTAMLDKYVLPNDEIIYKRCKYVVEEKLRLLEACDDLVKADLKAFGKKMFLTHTGLSNDYEVSCKELDFLVDYVKIIPAVIGARMVGGGFGGCTINLIKEEEINSIGETLSQIYEKEMNLPLTVYVAAIEDGTSQIL